MTNAAWPTPAYAGTYPVIIVVDQQAILSITGVSIIASLGCGVHRHGQGQMQLVAYKCQLGIPTWRCMLFWLWIAQGVYVTCAKETHRMFTSGKYLLLSSNLQLKH
jgi:hypothetical protein